ncbi:ATP-binding protein [Streptomyces sp. NPDC058751]|uniref:ATP-binding protein n=1 Tax=Streptomyces sp. NPDC058751 TaxID=3346623 RepID=UPI00367DEA9B
MATVSPPWSYTLQLPHDPRSPGIGRVTLRAILSARGLGELSPTAELLASELLTNAHLHAPGPYALRVLSAEPDLLRVAVWDSDPAVPAGFREDRIEGRPSYEDEHEREHGRGLHLVRACADAWGVSVLRELGASRGGKLLWAECRGPGPGRG